MAERIDIPKLTGPIPEKWEDRDTVWLFLKTPHGRDEEHPTLICGGCGYISTMSNHTIAADGTVKPSLLCPNDECSFHVWGKLLAWEEKLQKQG
jgi:hypothetical protein